MQYNISISDTCVSVVFEGKLQALDLIFMNQDPLYRGAIVDKKVLFLDFSHITGSELTDEDTQGLMLLTKLDSQKVKNMRLIIALGLGAPRGISQLCEKIFSDSSWQVTVCESRAQALTLI